MSLEFLRMLALTDDERLIAELVAALDIAQDAMARSRIRNEGVLQVDLEVVKSALLLAAEKGYRVNDA